MLELIGVSKVFGQKLIFKDVSFKVKKGDGIFILGPNGCGKSTLIRIIAGSIKPTTGSIKFDSQVKRIGYMGHFFSVYGELSSIENLRFWSELYGLKHKEEDLKDILEQLELGPVCYEKVSIFSRGMIQRLNIARLMVIDPHIYLLDEPETGLDIKSKQMLKDFVASELHRGKVVIWVTHLTLDSFFKKRLIFKNKTFSFETIEN
ncbi:ABC transporter ATP-binding protein [Desulfothermus sp.]